LLFLQSKDHETVIGGQRGAGDGTKKHGKAESGEAGYACLRSNWAALLPGFTMPGEGYVPLTKDVKISTSPRIRLARPATAAALPCLMKATSLA
jgi:hypothetical protein